MKKFTPHMMYSGKKSVKANSVEEHNSLAKKGYTHDGPKAKGGMKIKYKAGGKLDPTETLKGSASVDKIFYKGGKTRVNEAGNYTKPTMRKNLFNRIMAGTRGGNAGQWSARKAQLLAKLYKQKGGGYTS